jgi:hypothetical protein
MLDREENKNRTEERLPRDALPPSPSLRGRAFQHRFFPELAVLGRVRRNEVFGLPIVEKPGLRRLLPAFTATEMEIGIWEFVIGYRSATVPGSHRIPCVPRQVIGRTTTAHPPHGKREFSSAAIPFPPMKFPGLSCCEIHGTL